MFILYPWKCQLQVISTFNGDKFQHIFSLSLNNLSIFSAFPPDKKKECISNKVHKSLLILAVRACQTHT